LLFAAQVTVGALAAYLLGPERTGQRGAGAGAVAGLLAGTGAAFGLAATPLDSSFSQNMEVLCAAAGGCGLWLGASGIVLFFVLTLLLMFVPALSLSAVAGAIYGSRRGKRMNRAEASPAQQSSGSTAEDDAASVDNPEEAARPSKLNWPIINLGAALLLLMVLGLMATFQIVFIFQHGSVSSGGLVLVSMLTLFLWLAVFISVVFWFQKHPFRLWLGIMAWPLVVFALLIGVCPTCTWGQKQIVQGDSVFVYEHLPLTGYSQALAAKSGVILASDVYHDAVQFIDESSKNVIGTVAVGADPIGIVADEHAVWVVSEGSHEVYRINPNSLAVEAIIPISSRPLLAAAGAGAIWVTLPDTSRVIRIDPMQNKVTNTIAVGANPSGLAADERYVWVANQGGRKLTYIDATTGNVEGEVDVGTAPSFVEIADDAVWVAVQGRRSVVRIDPNNKEVVAKIQVRGTPMTLVGHEGAIWVTLISENTVLQIDTQSNEMVGDPIPVGERPMGIAASDSGIWVANFGDGSLGRIETVTNTSGDIKTAGEIVSIYLVSLFAFLGTVATVATLGYAAWLMLLAIGAVINRLTSTLRWVALAFVLFTGLVLTWLVASLASAEAAAGVLAATFCALVVLWKMRKSAVARNESITASA
jgi:DNA-binding beta-propeller fold protein YncE